MPRIGRWEPARFLGAAERTRVETDLFAPERLFEPPREALGVELEPVGEIMEAEAAGALGGQPLGGVCVALRFAERDRAARELAVLMKDRVERIFPSLIAQAVLQSIAPRAAIFEKAVDVGVARSRHPVERFFRRRPPRAQGRLVV